MNTKQFFQSELFTRILYGIAIGVSVLVIFQAGMFVGFRKASFSYRLGEQYYQTFGDRRPGFLPRVPRNDFVESHGVTGTVIKVNGSMLVIEGQDDVEKVVIVNKDTIIRRFREAIHADDLKVNDAVVIIGSPNDNAQIVAKLIRIVPSSSFDPMMNQATPSQQK